MRFIWIAVLGVGCASSVRETSLSRAQIGSKYARQTGYFAACGTTCIEEKTRGGIRHDAILDEITLARVTPQETCFDVIVRTDESNDEPLTELGASCGIDGRTQRAVIEDERVSVVDYAYVGMRQTAVVEGVMATEYVGMALSQPADKVFRVIERRGQVCCGLPAANRASLTLANKHFDVGVSKARLDMRWQLGS